MSAMAPVFSSMPIELKDINHWLLWRAQEGRKVPFSPNMPTRKASVTNPRGWDGFGVACAAYEPERDGGVGFVLTDDIGLAVIDVDHDTSQSAIDLLRHIGCQYIETSPSGQGLHGWGRYSGALPRKVGTFNGIDVEVYQTGRYMSVTGAVIDGRPFADLHGLADLSKALSPVPTQDTQETQETHEAQVGGAVLRRFVPKSVGGRNKSLFALARHLKGAVPDASREQLRGIIREWHGLALPTIGTTEFEISWGDFMRSWGAVRFPHGTMLSDLLRDLDNDPLPDGMAAMGYGSKALRLVRVCRRLQGHAGDKPFYIGARTAGEILEIHFTDAACLLRALIADGVIELVARGAGKQASQYRFVWGGRA